MKHALFVSTLLMFAIGISDSQAQTDNQFATFREYNDDIESRDTGIRTRCRDEWPSDFRMQKYCRDNQEEGYEEFWRVVKTFRARSEDDANITIANCVKDWVDETPDWRMLAYCMENQYEAFLELND